MKEITWLINFAFPFPAGCTPAQLLSILKQMAADWPGMPRFPWRVTRNIHKFRGSPPVNFHYLMIHRCLMGCAAHQVLNATFASREAVLAMILREKFEVIGMLRLLLIEAIHAETKRTGVPYIPDCSGPEDGHKHLTAEEIEKRRHDFQACIDGAIADFVRILELASVPGGLKGEFLGRKLRSWARGGDIPDEVTLPVLVERTSEGLVLHPCQEEMRKLLEAGKTLPKLVVEKARVAVGVVGGKVNGKQSSVNGKQSPVNGAGVGVQGPAVQGLAVQGSTAAPVPVRLSAKRVEAARRGSVVRDKGDRKAIRAEVERLIAGGLIQKEACRQAAEQAQKGRAGQHPLTMKYNLPPDEVTPSVARNVFKSSW